MNKLPITLHGREFHLSPLNLGDLRRLEPVLLGVESGIEKGFGSLLSLVPVIHASLVKLHPELAIHELEDLLDLANLSATLDRVLEVSGLTRKAAE